MAVLAGCNPSKFNNVNFYFKGSHLAVACHSRRGPFVSTSGYFLHILYLLIAISQTFVILNLNGSFYTL